jgi:hypothetical protein
MPERARQKKAGWEGSIGWSGGRITELSVLLLRAMSTPSNGAAAAVMMTMMMPGRAMGTPSNGEAAAGAMTRATRKTVKRRRRRRRRTGARDSLRLRWTC